MSDERDRRLGLRADDDSPRPGSVRRVSPLMDEAADPDTDEAFDDNDAGAGAYGSSASTDAADDVGAYGAPASADRGPDRIDDVPGDAPGASAGADADSSADLDARLREGSAARDADDDEDVPDLPDLLTEMFEMGASDLHVTVGVPPMVRVDGELQALPYGRVSPKRSKALLYSVMTDEQKARLEESKEVDFSFGLKNMARFRSNVFIQRGSVVGALRTIPWEIPPFDKLGLPPVVREICERPRGLVLVTGPTGSGKSTTLAAMIDYINAKQAKHILTIEDPIEYTHRHKTSIVNQRELHADTHSFAAAMRAALREDPDVVLIGEMRDLESTELALRLAETGHLTFATLHTNSAVQTVNRIIDIFPSGQQQQIRTQLSFTLEGVLSQELLPRADGGGRALALEILIPNSAVRNLIREEKVHQIASAMQAGQGESGMQTFNQSLVKLVNDGAISQATAMRASSDPRELVGMLGRGAEGSLDASAGGRRMRRK